LAFGCTVGFDDKIAFVVDHAILASLARKSLEIWHYRAGKTAVLPEIERMHEMARKAFDDVCCTDFGETFFVERRYVGGGAGIGALAPGCTDCRAEHQPSRYALFIGRGRPSEPAAADQTPIHVQRVRPFDMDRGFRRCRARDRVSDRAHPGVERT